MNERLSKLFTAQLWVFGIIGAGVFMFNVSRADAFLFGYLFLAIAPFAAWQKPLLSTTLHAIGLLWLPTFLLTGWFMPTPSIPQLSGEPVDAPCGFADCSRYADYTEQILPLIAVLFCIMYSLPVIHTLQTIKKLRAQ